MSRLVLVLLMVAGTARGAEPNTKAAAARIDSILAADWQRNGMQPNPPASDETFVRRIYLDIVGRIPTHRETQEFLADSQADKRAKLIDRLLASEGHAQHMFNYWADVLRVLSDGTFNGKCGKVTGTAYAEFVKESLRTNKPYDRFVRELLTAQGSATTNGAIGYYQRDRGMPLDQLAITTRVFLGTRIECAQCHNHPFDKWTQKEFYGLAAFTYGVQTTFGFYSPTFTSMLELRRQQHDQTARKQLGLTPPIAVPAERAAAERKVVDAINKLAADDVYLRQALNEMIIPIKHTTVSWKSQPLALPHDYQYADAAPKSLVPAVTLFEPRMPAPPNANPLELFAGWVTSPRNQRFTKVVANRLWKKVFGRGVVEPVDDWSDDVKPANPALLTALEQLMVASKYDLRAYQRVLFNTQAYQREVTRDEIAVDAVYRFPGPVLRRMTAEQIWDSFVTLINPAPDLPNLAARREREKLLLDARKLIDALNNLTPAEMLSAAMAASEIYREHSVKTVELQRKLAEARKQKDAETIAAVRAELASFRPLQIKRANDLIFVPAVRKLADMAAKSPRPKTLQRGTVSVSAVGSSSATGLTSDRVPGFEQIEVPGYESHDWGGEEATRRRLFLDEAKFYGISEPQQADFLNRREEIARIWSRAAELDSPAPPGHPLRDFGQSDRETVENANLEAGVPQVLVLLNGPIMAGVLGQGSQLRLALTGASSPEAEVETVYLTLFSRRPTDNERATWQAARDGGLGDVGDLVYALLNTQQFLFIQ